MATTTTPTTRAYGIGRDKSIQVRVTDTERAQLKKEATRRGYSSTSDFLRAVGLDATPEASDARKKELRALDKLETAAQDLALQIKSRHNIGGR